MAALYVLPPSLLKKGFWIYVDFVVVRSDNSGIRVDLDIEPLEQPETVC
jgi:hypothetical protein